MAPPFPDEQTHDVKAMPDNVLKLGFEKTAPFPLVRVMSWMCVEEKLNEGLPESAKSGPDTLNVVIVEDVKWIVPAEKEKREESW